MAVIWSAVAGAQEQMLPVMTVTDFSGEYEPAVLSNGFIGLRPGKNPYEECPVYVAGYVQRHEIFGSSRLAQCPNPIRTMIYVDGEELELLPQKQSLDMSCGEFTTTMRACLHGTPVLNVESVLFACRSVPGLVVQHVTITPTASVDVKIQIVPEIVPENGSVYCRAPYYEAEKWDYMIGLSSEYSKLGMASASSTGDMVAEGPGIYLIENAVPGRRYEMSQFVSLVPDAYSDQPEESAARICRWGKMNGYEKIRSGNVRSWEEIWKSRIRIIGDPEAQRITDIAFFYLHGEANPLGRLSIPCFGLSRGANYQGHIFWDADAWMLLPLAVTSPDSGRCIVEFRYDKLEEARDNARLYGYSGAQYPWQSATVIKGESCPCSAPTGWAEQHISCHVALAQWEYCQISGDNEYMEQKAFPVIRGVADWIASRGEWSDKGFEIKGAMGADESIEQVDNSSHINLAARKVMDCALKCAGELGYADTLSWHNVKESIYIPEHKGVVLPYENAEFVPHGKLYSLGMLQYLFVHVPEIPEKTYLRTFEFEDSARRVLDPSPSVPASPGCPGFASFPMSVASAFIGERETARTIFTNAWQEYYLPPFGLVSEYMHNDFGNYITSYGSLLQAVLFGYTGLRVTDDDNWAVYEATLPEGWERIECDRFYVHGKCARMSARNGEKATLSFAGEEN